MTNVISFRPRRRCVGVEHRCPFCGDMDGFVHIGAQAWGVCDWHQVKWYIGANISGDWEIETARDWEANAHYLDGLRHIYPDLPSQGEQA